MVAPPAAESAAVIYRGGEVEPGPPLDPGAPAVVEWSVGFDHLAGLTAAGGVVCCGDNSRGQLGCGGGEDSERPVAALMPWPASALACGGQFTAALRRGGGAVCSWGHVRSGGLPGGGAGRSDRPSEVSGLPRGDPVAILAAGAAFAIVITERDVAYGWGRCDPAALALGSGCGERDAPVRIPALSGRRVRRLACGAAHGVAEAAQGLLGWGVGADSWAFLARPQRRASQGRAEGLPRVLEGAAAMRYPLRSLAASCAYAAAADAAGAVRLWGWVQERHAQGARAGLPPGERAVRLAAAQQGAVALTESGALWDCGDPSHCRRIEGAARGLLPWGGGAGGYVVLAPDYGIDKMRARMFFLAAVRRRLLPRDLLLATAECFVLAGYIRDGLCSSAAFAAINAIE
eukprot:TRINITY_DN18788_c0_g1_i1.p1 TRINITY_DN18788_c0_g1~~TRINITY_DN18788_c0_g1_i1.p1  ORF type:complete len:426 (+),score=117.03 TRINITY_DN18788_c0_g1_i1:70-1278(+)